MHLLYFHYRDTFLRLINTIKVPITAFELKKEKEKVNRSGKRRLALKRDVQFQITSMEVLSGSLKYVSGN